jgi:hypothetical protein
MPWQIIIRDLSAVPNDRRIQSKSDLTNRNVHAKANGWKAL